MATIQEFLEGSPERDPARGKDLDNLFKAISQYESNRAVAAGAQLNIPEPQTEGFLSKFMTNIGAPGRAVRAGLLDVLGADVPELQGRSPLESAGAAFFNDINVGFGDVPGLRVEEGEGLPGRVAKLGAAFAGDVLTDPLSYLGAPSSLGRGVAARTLFSGAPDVLTKGSAALAAKGRPTAAKEIVARLRDEDRLVQASRMQEGMPAATSGVSPVDILSRSNLTDEQRASRVLGSRMAEALMTRGRNGVVDELTDVFGDRDVALDVLQQMPDDFLGGLRVLNPVTGRSVARLTPGTGEALGEVGEVANRARFWMSATGLGSMPTRFISGRSGATLADVKRGLRLKGQGKVDDVNRTRFSDYMAGREAMANLRLDRVRLSTRLQGTLTGILARQNTLTGGDLESFQAGVRDIISGTTAQAPDSTMRAEGRQAGEEMWSQLQSLYDEARATGVEIGNLGPDYRPLILNEEEFAKRQRLGMTAERGGEQAYSPAGGRQMWVMFEPDETIARQLGWEAGDPRVRALSAREINERLVAAGKKPMFEEDPYKIATRYGEALAERIAVKRFTNSLQDAGVLLGDVELTRKLLRNRRVAQLQSAVSKVSNRAGQNLEKAVQATEKELQDKVTRGTVEDLAVDLAEQRRTATFNFVQADDTVESLKEQLRDATTRARELRPTVRGYIRTLTDYADLDLGRATIREAENAARRAGTRVARSERAADAAMEDVYDATIIDSAVSESALARGAQPITPGRVETAREAMDEVVAAEEAARIARSDLDNLRGARVEAAGRLGVEQAAQVDRLVRALETRARLADELVVARRARAAAKQERDRVYGQTDGVTYDALQTAVNDFSSRVTAARTLTDKAEREAAIQQAATDLRKALGLHGRRKGAKAPELEQYVDTLVGLGRKLSEEDFAMTRVLASQEAVGRLSEAYQTGIDDRDGLFAAFDDLYRAYTYLRKNVKVTAKEFDDLSKGERALFSKSGRLDRAAFEAERKANLENSELFNKVNSEADALGIMPLVGNGTTRLPEGAKGLWAPIGIREMMEQVFQSYSNPTKFQRWLNDVVDPLLLTWKMGVTVGSGPRYLLLNAVSNLYMNYIGGVSMQAHVQAANVLNRFWDKFRQIGRDAPDEVYFARIQRAVDELREEFKDQSINGRNVIDLLEDFIDGGGFTSTQVFFTAERVLAGGEATATRALTGAPGMVPEYATREVGRGEAAYRKGIEFLMTNRVQTFLNSMNQASEMWSRYANFIDGYKRYGNQVAAFDRMNALLFDYQDLSVTEEYIRRFIPFYTWTRNNIPLQVKTMFLQPGKIQKFIYLNENAKQAFGVDEGESWMDEFLPEYAKLGGGWLTGLVYDENPLFFSSRLPYTDVDRLLEFNTGGPFPFVRESELANMLGPVATVPYELVTGVNPATGRKDEEGQLFRTLSELVPYYGTGIRALSGVSALPIPGVQQGLQAALPVLSQQENINEKALQNLLNMSGVGAGLGGSFGTLTPRALSGEFRRRIDVQQAALQAFAEEQGIDLQWIRDQVREGATPEQIASMIQSGQGRPRVEPVTIGETAQMRALGMLG